MTAFSPIPDVEVRINDAALPEEAYPRLDVEVQDDTEALSACTLTLRVQPEGGEKIQWVDDDLFAVGGELEVKLSGPKALETVFKGEITGLELELSGDEEGRFVVRGYDRRHRLLRGTHTRTFAKTKDSDIAAQLARDNGLSADVEDTGVEHAYVLQDGRSDLEFLQSRAARIGYEVKVDDKKLSFRPLAAGESSITLQADVDLREISFRLTAREQIGKVEVYGWDPSNKEEIVGKAASGDLDPMGDESGPDVGDSAFGEATLHLVDHALDTQDAADQTALGALKALSLSYVTAEGACRGRADVRAGMFVEIKRVGKRFSGKYYLTSVTHRFSPKSGFVTSFSARRDAT